MSDRLGCCWWCGDDVGDIVYPIQIGAETRHVHRLCRSEWKRAGMPQEKP